MILEGYLMILQKKEKSCVTWILLPLLFLTNENLASLVYANHTNLNIKIWEGEEWERKRKTAREKVTVKEREQETVNEKERDCEWERETAKER